MKYLFEQHVAYIVTLSYPELGRPRACGSHLPTSMIVTMQARSSKTKLHSALCRAIQWHLTEQTRWKATIDNGKILLYPVRNGLIIDGTVTDMTYRVEVNFEARPVEHMVDIN